jgi:hypothetical protein
LYSAISSSVVSQNFGEGEIVCQGFPHPHETVLPAGFMGKMKKVEKGGENAV